ncbi:MAG: hypothetical protein ABW318_16630 [Vicinamibacterales bacterium]
MGARPTRQSLQPEATGFDRRSLFGHFLTFTRSEADAGYDRFKTEQTLLVVAHTGSKTPK